MKDKANDSVSHYVLDTSAILTLREEEEGADQVEDILRQSQSGMVEVYASFMAYMETFYRVWQVEGESSAKRTYAELLALPIKQVSVTQPILLKAGAIKAQFQLSVADAWTIATAAELGATLVHKDPEMEQAKPIANLLALPYKN
jgi:predicted nucleic acid-binding protein